jgi:protein-S-isoprenylcysteine O-methyltransferase Ste14
MGAMRKLQLAGAPKGSRAAGTLQRSDLSARPPRELDRGAPASLLADRLMPALLFGTTGATTALRALGVLGDRPADLAGLAALSYGLDVAHTALTALFFSLVAALFLSRRAPRGRRARPLSIAVAVTGTFVMSAVATQPATTADWRILLLADALLILGLAIAICAVIHLRHCFAIAPEARGVVASGPYRRIRHPLYLGEGIAAVGALLPVVAPLTALIFGLFCLCQVLRARLEERVLADTFPEYLAYCGRTPALLPWPRPSQRARDADLLTAPQSREDKEGALPA